MTAHLDRLADFLGILPSYVDYGGKPRQTSPETRRAIMKAMGHHVTDDASAGDLLNAILDEELRLAPELSLGQGLVDCIRRERTYADERAKWWTGSATAWRDAEAEVLGGAA